MIGIIGAGITGLTIHHELRERGVASRVLEASGRPGGVIRTIHRDGHVLDCGPQRTRLTARVRRLIDDVGLTERVVRARDLPLFIAHDGRLRRVPRSLRDAAGTDLLSWRGKLRVLLEPVTAPPRDGESVRAYLARAFGAEFADRIGGPLYAGLYASSPAEMPVQHSLSRAFDRFGIGRSVLLWLLRARARSRSPPPVVSFETGMRALPRAIHERHPESIELDTPVASIRDRDDGFDLVTDRGSVSVDGVVVTTPAGIAAALLSRIDPGTATALDALTYNPLAVVHLDADTGLVGSGYTFAAGSDRVTLGVTANEALFSHAAEDAGMDRTGVHTCFLGGARHPEAVSWSDDRLGDVAATEFTAVTGASATPINVHRVEPGMPAYDRSWAALDRVDPPDGIVLAGSYGARAGIPGRVEEAASLASGLRERHA